MSSAVFSCFLSAIAAITVWHSVMGQLTDREVDVFRGQGVNVSSLHGMWYFSTQWPLGQTSTGEDSNSISIPQDPSSVRRPQCLLTGTIALLVNGVPLLNPFSNAGKVTTTKCTSPAQMTIQDFKELIQCILDTAVTNVFIGVALDGHPIYKQDSTMLEKDFDICHGVHSNGRYVYFLSYNFPYIMPCLRQGSYGYMDDSAIKKKLTKDCRVVCPDDVAVTSGSCDTPVFLKKETNIESVKGLNQVRNRELEESLIQDHRHVKLQNSTKNQELVNLTISRTGDKETVTSARLIDNFVKKHEDSLPITNPSIDHITKDVPNMQHSEESHGILYSGTHHNITISQERLSGANQILQDILITSTASLPAQVPDVEDNSHEIEDSFVTTAVSLNGSSDFVGRETDEEALSDTNSVVNRSQSMVTGDFQDTYLTRGIETTDAVLNRQGTGGGDLKSTEGNTTREHHEEIGTTMSLEPVHYDFNFSTTTSGDETFNTANYISSIYDILFGRTGYVSNNSMTTESHGGILENSSNVNTDVNNASTVSTMHLLYNKTNSTSNNYTNTLNESANSDSTLQSNFTFFNVNSVAVESQTAMPVTISTDIDNIVPFGTKSQKNKMESNEPSTVTLTTENNSNILSTALFHTRRKHKIGAKYRNITGTTEIMTSSQQATMRGVSGDDLGHGTAQTVFGGRHPDTTDVIELPPRHMALVGDNGSTIVNSNSSLNLNGTLPTDLKSTTKPPKGDKTSLSQLEESLGMSSKMMGYIGGVTVCVVGVIVGFIASLFKEEK